jgi:hypothetical protein
MNTTILNYPGFQNLPRGVKQMLLASEAHFFDQAAPHYKDQERVAQEMRTHRGFKVLLTACCWPLPPPPPQRKQILVVWTAGRQSA